MNNSYLTALFKDLSDISRVVQESFGKLDEVQLNWKPEPDAWSIGQCLDHLVISNKTYFPTFVQLADGTKRQRKRERLPILPAVGSNWLQRFMSASARHKQQAPAKFRPSSNLISSDILARFSEHQMILADLIQRLDPLDHANTIITSPVNSLVTVSLKDLCQFLVEHERRHLAQAQGLLTQRHFPRQQKS